ncbi:tape measure protein [Acinetobacter sp. SA01]|uniref:tape measure protein n=1 Tax=Acinetobacter sp. SA01 TaxID=1862567 RepID=UPI00140DD85E|nr:tape measure protein [Acinetobacter sp. SA01]
MSGKNLTFKLVMDADTKGFDTGTKASKDKWEAFISVLKKESEALKTTSADASKAIGNIVPDELNKNTKEAKDGLAALSRAAENAGETAKRAGFEIGEAIPGDAVQLAESLGNKFFTAAKEIEALGDKSTISAGELRAMSSAGEQGLNALNLALKASQAELVRLQSTDGTLKDIEIAKQRVFSIQDAINEASSAFNYYQGVAINAMKGVDNATQSAINKVQQFSSVDLTGVVGEVQTASRAIESMGDGAAISSKELERVGQLGTQAINSLQNELQQANLELKALSQSSDAVPLSKFNEATAKVNALEDALSLTKTAYTDFQTRASTAMGSVSSSTDKASNSATQAGHAIYAALGKTPPTVINDAIANLSKKLEDFKANSKMPAEEVARVTRLTEQEIARLRSELDGVDTSASKANMGMGTLSKGVDATKFAVTALVGAMAALGVGLSIRELAQAADSYTNLSARINIATSEGGNFKQAMAGVHQIALATNSSLDATGNLFAKINDTGKEMGMTQQQALDLTKTINQAIQIGGGSAQASEAAVQQFIQALQSGVLRGDEFNSIMEQAPGLTSAMAKGLGVATSELRKMAENGELGAERVVKALQSQASEVQKTYDKFPLTISNALQKISTQWQILIGEMDQANGSSATVANALSVIADNLGILKGFFDDVAEGVGYLKSKFDDIDPSTLNALRDTLTQVYENVKQNIKYFADFGETAWSAFTSAMDAVSPLFNALVSGGEDVNGFTTFLNMLRMAMAAVSDVSFGFNVGLKVLLSSVQFLAGGFYSLTAAMLQHVPFMGAVADEAEKASDRMFAQAEKNMRGAIQLSNEHKWAVVETRNQIQQTEEQKNAESVESSKKKLEQLLAHQQTEVNGTKVTESEKMSAVQAYAEAAIKANGGVMDGVMQADLLTKGYIVTINQAGKVSVQAGESAAQSAENAKAKEEALKLAKENVKKADEEYLAFQKQAAIERAALDQQIQQAKASGDLNELKQAQDKVNQINAKEAELANNRNLRIAELNQLNSGSGQVVESAYSRASAAANQFGVDLDVSLNKVSKSFTASGNGLTELQTKLNNAGVTGQNAANVLYQAWESWLNKAKSPAEIDAANAKLREFEAQGVFSTKQVELGIMAIRNANAKLPDELDETGKAFERLGIKTKEQLKLSAQQAVMDYIKVRDSGKATAEGVDSAYQKMMQTVAASGDVGVIAAANTMNAGRNLEIQIDATGKASVKSMSELEASINRAGNSFKNIENGARSAGNVVREEAQSAGDAWQAAVAKSNKEFRDEMKRQGEALSSMYDYQSYSKSDVLAALKSKGYSDQEAQKLAGSIWSEGLAADRDAKFSSLGNSGPLTALINAEFDRAAARGLTTQNGTNKINELLRQLNSNSLASVGSLPKAPSVDINSLAPNVNANLPTPDTSSEPKNTTRIELVSGNKTATVYADASSGNALQEMLRELETLKKST